MVRAADRRKPKREQAQRGPVTPMGIAFICFGNACRSQMAEAWARYYGGEHVTAQSAGVHPLGEVTAETRAVMGEKEIRLDGQYSKGLDAIDWTRVDIVVNMSPHPTEDLLPAFSGRCFTWKVQDPFSEPVETYRRVRDELGERVRALVEELTAPAAAPEPL